MQNSVIRLKSNILPPPKYFGLATPLQWSRRNHRVTNRHFLQLHWRQNH